MLPYYGVTNFQTVLYITSKTLMIRINVFLSSWSRLFKVKYHFSLLVFNQVNDPYVQNPYKLTNVLLMNYGKHVQKFTTQITTKKL